MATKPSKNVAKQDGWVQKGFVNLYLTERQLADCWAFYEKAEKVKNDWHDEMHNGYRFTFSVDGKSGSIVCSVNCKDQSSPNSGWLLTSFAPTWEEALKLSLYKHLVILEANWGDNESAAPRASYG